jgi:hypothetical protein
MTAELRTSLMDCSMKCDWSKRSRACRPRQLLVPLVDALAQRARDRHRVGVAFLEHGDLDAFLAVDARDFLTLFRAPAHGGDVAQPHRRAVAVGDDDLSDLGDAIEFVQGADQELHVGAAQRTPGQVHVRHADHFAHAFERYTERRQAFLVDIDVDFVFQAALDLRRRDALDGFQVELDLAVGEVAHLVQLAGAGECDAHDRVE